MRATSLKSCVIRFLYNRDGRPSFLNEIYAAIAEQRKKENDESFRAQIRGILNASLKKNEGLFERIPKASGLYTLASSQKTFDDYVEDLEKAEKQQLEYPQNDKAISRAEALKIYYKHINFAYHEANKLHGSSCIVSLEDLQSASQIALFKGACEFKPFKAKSDGASPIPYLKKYVRGILLNVIREQKVWQTRNLRVNSPDAISILKVDNFDDISGGENTTTEDLSISELREVLIDQMKQHLNDDEFEVVSKRWGLDGKGGLTFKQIGKDIVQKSQKDNSDDSAKSWSWQIERTARRKLCKKSKILRNIFESYYA